MKFQNIELANITATTNNYNDNDLQAAAIAINELGCLAYPIVVQQVSYTEYSIIGNDFYYHAVVRAIQLGGKFEEVPTMCNELQELIPASRRTTTIVTPVIAADCVARQTFSQTTPQSPVTVIVEKIVEIVKTIEIEVLVPVVEKIKASVKRNTKNVTQSITDYATFMYYETISL
jgi:hypothetical protein